MDTSHNLLRQAQSDLDSEAWDRLVRIYEPLIVRWLTNFRISPIDVPDITQDVLLAAARDLTRFEHNGRQGAFRNWLRTIALNRCRRHWQKLNRRISTVQIQQMGEQIEQLANCESELCQKWNQEHDEYVLRGLLDLMSHEFDETTMQVFYEVALAGESPADVAEKHGWTLSKTYQAKFRVLQRLRSEGKQFLE